MRIDKFLSNSGVGTRNEVKVLIKNKKVFINEKLVVSSNETVDEINDKVFVNNSLIIYKPFVYIMLNKPKGVISATEDKKIKTVIDLLNNDFYTYSLFPVGRLDIDTEGLIILTNDGKLSHKLLSPKKHISKTYYVELKNSLSEENIIKIESGVDIGDYVTKNDAKINKINDTSLYITITEGKFHQIKRMFLAVNNEVLYLKRIAMNKLKLDENLNLGEYKELSCEELNLLKDGI